MTNVIVPVCFPAGTRILLEDGTTKLIEQFEGGERVRGAFHEDPEGPISVGEVIEVYHHEPRNLIGVEVGGDLIRCTPKHPFYVRGRGWTAAAELRPGDSLRVASGDFISVGSVVDNGQVEPVFNIQVAGLHTYFVCNEAGDVDVLVHNDSGVDDSGDRVTYIPDLTLGKTTYTVTDAKLDKATGKVTLYLVAPMAQNSHNEQRSRGSRPTTTGGIWSGLRARESSLRRTRRNRFRKTQPVWRQPPRDRNSNYRTSWIGTQVPASLRRTTGSSRRRRVRQYNSPMLSDARAVIFAATEAHAAFSAAAGVVYQEGLGVTDFALESVEAGRKFLERLKNAPLTTTYQTVVGLAHNLYAIVANPSTLGDAFDGVVRTLFSGNPRSRGKLAASIFFALRVPGRAKPRTRGGSRVCSTQDGCRNRGHLSPKAVELADALVAKEGRMIIADGGKTVEVVNAGTLPVAEQKAIARSLS